MSMPMWYADYEHYRFVIQTMSTMDGRQIMRTIDVVACIPALSMLSPTYHIDVIACIPCMLSKI